MLHNSPHKYSFSCVAKSMSVCAMVVSLVIHVLQRCSRQVGGGITWWLRFWWCSLGSGSRFREEGVHSRSNIYWLYLAMVVCSLFHCWRHCMDYDHAFSKVKFHDLTSLVRLGGFLHYSFPGGVVVWRTYFVVKLVFPMVVVVSCCCEPQITWVGIFYFLFFLLHFFFFLVVCIFNVPLTLCWCRCRV
jgi:hypothetical protein